MGAGVVLEVLGSGVVDVLCSRVVDVLCSRVVDVLVSGVVDVLVQVNFCPLESYVKTVGPKLHAQFQIPIEPSGPVEYSGHAKHWNIELLLCQ